MFIDLLRRRRSIRRFDSRPIEQHKTDLLLEAMLRSPSSRSLNPWEFVVVSDPATIAALAQAKTHGSAFMRSAPLAIVVCADPERCDVWVEDTAIATLLIHLQATDLGLGSCWVQIRKRDHAEGVSAESYLVDLLGLRPVLRVEAMVAVGYPAEDKQGHPADTLLFERIHRHTP